MVRSGSSFDEFENPEASLASLGVCWKGGEGKGARCSSVSSSLRKKCGTSASSVFEAVDGCGRQRDPQKSALRIPRCEYSVAAAAMHCVQGVHNYTNYTNYTAYSSLLLAATRTKFV